jgi:hypothetical protein
MIFYLGREKRERAEKMSSLVKCIVETQNHLVLRLIPMQCVKRGEWESGYNDIFVLRKAREQLKNPNNV